MKILFATDGSDGAAAAGRLLATLPFGSDTRVTVLSVVPEHNWVNTPVLSEVSEEEMAAARQTAQSAAALLEPRGVAVEVRVRYQNPAEAILEQAEAEGTELIVVGSHGKGAVERFLIGSVSERVARYAPCSVLVARGDKLRRVLVAADGSPSSERSLDALARLSLPAEVEMKVLHVLHSVRLRLPAPPTLVPGLDWDRMTEAYDREAHAEGERIVRHAQDLLDRAGRPATTEVRCGAPDRQLIAAAREWTADLLVVGAANRSPLGQLSLGSVSSRLLSHAPCSVLVARSD